MASLKSFLPTLSDILDLSRDTLHVRQRALVEVGLLDAAPGRGPGSGAKLTPKNVAALLISFIAAQDLRFVDSNVVAICKAKMLPDAGPAPSKLTFLEAVAEALVEKPSKDEPPKVETISVTRLWRAQIIDPWGNADDYFPAKRGRPAYSQPRDAWWTGSFPSDVFSDLRDATRPVISVAENEGEED